MSLFKKSQVEHQRFSGPWAYGGSPPGGLAEPGMGGRRVRRGFSCRGLGSGLFQVADSHQVVNRHRPSQHPGDSLPSAVPHLAHQSDRFQPAEDLLQAFANPLAHRVTGMARGTTINGAAAATFGILAPPGE